MEVFQIPVLQDNYIYILRDPETETTAVIDPAEAQPVTDFLTSRKWSLHFILNTHHHPDHVGGNLDLKKRWAAKVCGFDSDAHRLPGLDISLKEGESFFVGHLKLHILFTPGHTLGHILYYCPEYQRLFCGDTLFAMGCGRLFEGTAEQMYHSLMQIKSLPPQTLIYCTHEYTLKNAEFALTIEPGNADIQKRFNEVTELRAKNLPTVPFRLTEELKTNPFLRTDQPHLQKLMHSHDPVETFAKIRQRRNQF